MATLKEIKELCCLLSSRFEFDKDRVSALFLNAIADFRIRYRIFKPILSRIDPARVFVAPRATYQYGIALCEGSDNKMRCV